MSIESASTNLTPLLSTIGFGGIVGFLIGFMLKKVMKILAIIAGALFAFLLYLQSQEMLNIYWDRLQNTSQGIVSAITAALTTTTAAGGSMSIPGIQLTTGSAAVGFTIGFMKG
ncbi:MAG: FUN14 domain-containing protein [Nitrososphaeraceae archaeon]|nr:FUN14 domain-containing protein [Nitrososphaeraceae archaeon]